MHSRGLKALEFSLKKGCDYQVPKKIERGSVEDKFIEAALCLVDTSQESLPSEIVISNIDSVIKYSPAKLLALLVIESVYSKDLPLLANYREFLTPELNDALVSSVLRHKATENFNECIDFIMNNYSLICDAFTQLKTNNSIEMCEHPKVVEMVFVNIPTTSSVLVTGESRFTSVCYDTWMDVDKRDLNEIYSIIETGVTPRNAIEKMTRSKEKCSAYSFIKFIEIEYLMEVFKCILV